MSCPENHCEAILTFYSSAGVRCALWAVVTSPWGPTLEYHFNVEHFCCRKPRKWEAERFRHGYLVTFVILTAREGGGRGITQLDLSGYALGSSIMPGLVTKVPGSGQGWGWWSVGPEAVVSGTRL